MMLGLGVGGFVAGIFHLMTHAFFKALLFLGSGSVIHGTGTQDMREMGGLRKVMPYTFWTFLIGSLSIAGIFPLAGFWSKDEILADVWAEGPAILFFVAVVAAFITAFYMFRIIFMTFAGEYRGPAAQAEHTASGTLGGGHGSVMDHGSGEHEGHAGPHESPWVMLIPLIVLAVLAVAVGWVNATGWFAGFLTGHEEEITYNIPVMGTSLGVALLGIFFAYAVYGAKWIPAESFTRSAAMAWVHKVVINKYYMDHLYGWLISTVMLGFFSALAWFDVNVVDGVVNGAAWLTTGTGRAIRLLESGRTQAYALGIFLGVLVIYLGFLIRVS
jgi:NADH-quinone oxidoreductase subunit L